jgi:hypothetical protein
MTGQLVPFGLNTRICWPESLLRFGKIWLWEFSLVNLWAKLILVHSGAVYDIPLISCLTTAGGLEVL